MKNISVRIFFFICLLCVVGCQSSIKHPEKDLTAYVRDLNSEDPRLRAEAKNIIPTYGKAAVKPLLSFLLLQKNEAVRNDGIVVLSKIKTSESAGALVTLFKQTHDYAAIDALSGIGEPALAPLHIAVGDPDPYIRFFTLCALGKISMGDEKSCNNEKQIFLGIFKNDSSAMVRDMALACLMPYRNDDNIRPVFDAALNDKDKIIRATAEQILNYGVQIYPDCRKEWLYEIDAGIEKYHALNNEYPENLAALIPGDYVKKEWMVNPFGFSYIYRVANDRKTYSLISPGRYPKEACAGMSTDGKYCNQAINK
jgi:hypothetical protein